MKLFRQLQTAGIETGIVSACVRIFERDTMPVDTIPNPTRRGFQSLRIL